MSCLTLCLNCELSRLLGLNSAPGTMPEARGNPELGPCNALAVSPIRISVNAAAKEVSHHILHSVRQVFFRIW